LSDSAPHHSHSLLHANPPQPTKRSTIKSAVDGGAAAEAPAAPPAGKLPPAPHAQSANDESSGPTGTAKNNYARPSGQNVGNYLSGRNSSRVLAPPGGVSSIKFG